MIIIYYYN